MKQFLLTIASLSLLMTSSSYAAGLSGKYLVDQVVLGPSIDGQNVAPQCNIFSNYGNAAAGTTMVVDAGDQRFTLSVIVPAGQGLGPTDTLVTDDIYDLTSNATSPYNPDHTRFTYGGDGFEVSMILAGGTLRIHDQIEGFTDAGHAATFTVDCIATYLGN